MAGFTIKVENVVAYTVLGKQIPLNKLVAKVGTAEYRPEQFPGLVYRVKEPKAAALIFSSGKIVCTGTKSIEDARVAVANVVKKIMSVGVPVPDHYDVHIENIVAATKTDSKLNLREISFSLESAEYDQDKFNGMIYRLKEPRVDLVLFHNGKIICTGATKINDIYTAINKLKSRLESVGVSIKPIYV